MLKECISRAGSLEGGLKYYVGAANLVDDGGYADKVLAEQSFLRQVVLGRQVPVTAKLPQPSASASSGVQLGATTATTTQLAMR